MGRSIQLAREYGLWGKELGATETVRPGFHSGLRSVSNSNGHVSYAILSNEKKRHFITPPFGNGFHH